MTYETIAGMQNYNAVKEKKYNKKRKSKSERLQGKRSIKYFLLTGVEPMYFKSPMKGWRL